MAKRLILLFAIFLVAVPTSAAGSDLAKRDRSYAQYDCVHLKKKPDRIDITCADAGFFYEKLKWKKWERDSAKAKGTANVNDCKPSCANGTFRRYKGKLKLTRPKFCDRVDRLMFTRAKVTAKGAHLKNDKFSFSCKTVRD